MSRPLWFVEIVKKSFPTRFLLARLTHLPVIGDFIEQQLFGGDDIIYLPKDKLVIHIDQPVDRPAETAVPSAVVKHFIHQAEVRWIMNNCLCRDAAKCEDYPRDLGCLFLGRAAMDINPALGRPVTEEEALAHLERCSRAGLVHLIGRNKIDTVWLGAGPGHKLVTICSCCPCCCLWRMLPDVSPSIRAKVNRLPGVTVSVTDRCEGCGDCVGSCFVKAIDLDGDRAVIDQEACMGCGRCIETCSEEAIELTIDDRLFVEKAIGQLSGLFDLS